MKMPRLRLIALTVLFACAAPVDRSEGQSAQPAPASAIQPWEGERLIFCDSPELTATIKVDPRSTGSTRFTMGTGDLAAGTNNSSRGHGTGDELIFVVRGNGWAVLAQDTVPIHPGTTLFIPRGLPHTFGNPGTEVMHFVWVQAPTGFEDGLREVGRAPGTPCS